MAAASHNVHATVTRSDGFLAVHPDSLGRSCPSREPRPSPHQLPIEGIDVWGRGRRRGATRQPTILAPAGRVRRRSWAPVPVAGDGGGAVGITGIRPSRNQAPSRTWRW